MFLNWWLLDFASCVWGVCVRVCVVCLCVCMCVGLEDGEKGTTQSLDLLNEHLSLCPFDSMFYLSTYCVPSLMEDRRK